MGDTTASANLRRELLTALTRLGWLVFRPRYHHRGQLGNLEYLALVVLRDQGPRTVGALNRLLGLAPAQGSRLVNRLVQPPGLVNCTVDRADRRRFLMSLTAAGQQALADHEVKSLAPLQAALAGLSSREQTDLTRLLGHLCGLLGQENQNGQGD